MGKMMGAAVLVFVGWYIGASAGLRYKGRVTELEKTADYLESFAARLAFSGAPPDRIAAELCRDPAFASSLFAGICGRCPTGEPFSPWLCRAAEEYLSWSTEAVSALQALASVLGGFPVQTQLEALQLCRDRLERIRFRIQPEMMQKLRLLRSIGVLGGAAAVILLW